MDERIRKQRFLRRILAVVLCISAGSAAALPERVAGIRGVPGITYVTIRGNVIAPPPCVINNGNTILVDFGEVMSTRIDGQRYKQPVNYTAECTKMPTNAMTLAITGNTAGFDAGYYRLKLRAGGAHALSGTATQSR